MGDGVRLVVILDSDGDKSRTGHQDGHNARIYGEPPRAFDAPSLSGGGGRRTEVIDIERRQGVSVRPQWGSGTLEQTESLHGSKNRRLRQSRRVRRGQRVGKDANGR